MSEQIKRCLSEVVDIIDADRVDSAATQRLSEMVIGTLPRDEGEQMLTLNCDVLHCGLWAKIIERNSSVGDPEYTVRRTSEDHTIPNDRHTIGACHNVTSEVFPLAPDDGGCSAAQYSYALSKLGIKASPQEIDTMTGRKPNEGLKYAQEDNLLLGLLRLGCDVEDISPVNNANFDNFLHMEPGKAYEAFCDQYISAYGEEDREWLDTKFTEAMFRADIERYRKSLEKFAGYKKSGQYRLTLQDLTPSDVTRRLKTQVMLVAAKNPEENYPHAVVVEDVKEVNGGLVVKYFSPLERDSCIETRRVSSLEDIFYMQEVRFLSAPKVLR